MVKFNGYCVTEMLQALVEDGVLTDLGVEDYNSLEWADAALPCVKGYEDLWQAQQDGLAIVQLWAAELQDPSIQERAWLHAHKWLEALVQSEGGHSYVTGVHEALLNIKCCHSFWQYFLPLMVAGVLWD